MLDAQFAPAGLRFGPDGNLYVSLSVGQNAISGGAVSLAAIFFTVYPIIDVPSPLSFAVKIVAVTGIANAIGIAIFVIGKKRRSN